MNKERQDRAYFLSFCIEQYKNENRLTGMEAMSRLDRYGVLQYLDENFEILHTQSKQWLLADIEEFINIRKKRQ